MHWIALPWPPADCEAAALAKDEAAAWWALQFTPRVALLDEALLLEVSTTQRLWGGLKSLLQRLMAAYPVAISHKGGLQDVPKDVPFTQAKTALLALALLRMALCRQPLPQGLPADLPLHTLTALRPHVPSLARMGCRTWGALRNLPRAGVARRFGAGVLRALDQAYGDAPEALPWLELPETFERTTELAAVAENASALLWSAGRLLSTLQSWLQARQQGALALQLTWQHDLRRLDGVDVPATSSLQVRTARPTQDIAHLRRLLSENLARTTLAAPVRQIGLRLLEAAPLPHASASLLPPGDGESAGAAQSEALHQLLERLSARLGAQRVQHAVLQTDHRPECMQHWQAAQGGQAGHSHGQGLHAPLMALGPTWLLRPPRRLTVQGDRPCHHGLLRLLAGPQRLEAGWWSQADGTPQDQLALRDYFVAFNETAGLVWVYRERLGSGAQRQEHWFLHGLYA